ncbi:MgtC/SapB family protein [Microbacterium sp.]|uniref:MgtC/SapB family protein n=1 Tax=Microbacterium sp. TaxID=51671 RepID=UPI00281216F2|nr:MgtC/SapB family protein [Microbacterium sp.]
MTWVDLSLRLLVSLAAGLALGMERELRGHPAGLRTHVLVSMGSAMFTLAGAYGFEDVIRGANADPARIGAQVASGIGFIGAGAILRDGATIRGLTTAATLWLAASVGVMSGAGNYALVLVGTGLVLIALVGVPYLRPARWRRKHELVVRLDCDPEPTVLPTVLATIGSPSVVFGEIDVKERRSRNDQRIVMKLEAPASLTKESLVQRLSNIAGVNAVRVRRFADAA